MENMNRGRNLINEKKEEKEERDVPLYCNITVACSICFTLSDTQYKGAGNITERIQSSAGSRKINSP